MNKYVWFDMDGTIADLYGVENWLDDLLAENTRPYEVAQPLFNFSAFARQLHRIQKAGYKIGVISWTCKGGTNEYNKRTAEAKKIWLKKHLPSVIWDEIHIVEYGYPKYLCGQGILFDDEIGNREAWQGIAYDVKNINETLKFLLTIA